MYCKLCGKHYSGGSSVCPSCGAQAESFSAANDRPYQPSSPPQEEKRFSGYTLVADIIALLMPFITLFVQSRTPIVYALLNAPVVTTDLVPKSAKTILFVLLLVLTAIAIILSLASKNVRKQNRIGSVVFAVIMFFVSVWLIQLY